VDSNAFSNTSTHACASVVGAHGAAPANTDAHIHYSTLANVDVDAKANSAACAGATGTGGTNATASTPAKANVRVRPVV